MKPNQLFLAVAAPFILLSSAPALAQCRPTLDTRPAATDTYDPPTDIGGPDSSQGSGTRLKEEEAQQQPGKLPRGSGRLEGN